MGWYEIPITIFSELHWKQSPFTYRVERLNPLKSRHDISNFQWLMLFRIATGIADILRYLMTYLDHPNWNEKERLVHKDFYLSRSRTWIRIRNEDKWSPSLDLFSGISVVTAFLNFWNPSIISWVMAIFIFLIFQI